MKIPRRKLLSKSGVRFDNILDLIGSLSEFRQANLVIQRMEIMRKEGEHEIPEIELSIIGADGETNWEKHKNIEAMHELAEAKLARAASSGHAYCVKVWFED